MKIATFQQRGKEIRPYRRKGLERAKKLLTEKCSCGNIYETEADHKGVKLNYYCDECKRGEDWGVDFSGNLGDAIYNVVPDV